ncbi:AraC family transcriptional regulator [Dongshaea marina]|uniref:AraC family transcriptional regulator n=1 Tax=Dongshaea marina TaxID=2047966 RepID=UPI000D3E8CC7|nr:AraC family transcriptional regulator [Dongshaea marina]
MISEPLKLRHREYQCGESTTGHQHPHPQLVYIHRGCGILGTAIGTQLVTNGELIWVPGKTEHSFEVLKNSRASLIYILQSPASMPDAIIKLEVTPVMIGLIDALGHRLDDNGSLKHSYQQVFLDQLGQLTQLDEPSLPLLDRRLLPIIGALSTEPGINLSLRELSKRYGPSERTLNRLFSQTFGCSFRFYRNQLVMSKARQWLAEGRSMTRIALDLGYQSLPAFSSAYHSYLRQREGNS